MHTRKIGILLVPGRPSVPSSGWSRAAGTPDRRGRGPCPGRRTPLPLGHEGRAFQFVSSLTTVVMIDTQTGKTYPLMPPSIRGLSTTNLANGLVSPSRIDDVEVTAVEQERREQLFKGGRRGEEARQVRCRKARGSTRHQGVVLPSACRS